MSYRYVLTDRQNYGDDKVQDGRHHIDREVWNISQWIAPAGQQEERAFVIDRATHVSVCGDA